MPFKSKREENKGPAKRKDGSRRKNKSCRISEFPASMKVQLGMLSFDPEAID
jgi:hypothetical protein